MKKAFHVKAIWDENAKVFYSESDIVGLHIEAATLEEFQQEMEETAVDLVIANHIQTQDLAGKTLTDLIPTIFWECDTTGMAAA